MSEHAVKRHISPVPTPLAAPADAPAGELSSLERLSVEAFATGSASATQAVVDQIQLWATALRGSRRDEARMQLLAQALAVSRARTLRFEAVRDEFVLKGQFENAAFIEHVLAREHRRFVALLAEHRVSCSTGTRSVNVTVGAAQNVAVIAGGES